MATFDVITSQTWTQFLVTNPGWNGATDAVYVSESAVLTLDQNITIQYFYCGDNAAGTAVVKEGRIYNRTGTFTATFKATGNYATVGMQTDPSMAGTYLFCDLQNDNLTITGEGGNSYLLLNYYQNTSDGTAIIDCANINLFYFVLWYRKNPHVGAITIKSAELNTISGQFVNLASEDLVVSGTQTFDGLTWNSTCSINIFRTAPWGDFHKLIINNFTNKKAYSRLYIKRIRSGSGYNMQMEEYLFTMFGKHATALHLAFQIDPTAQTVPEAITITLADGTDGTLDAVIPSISGSPQPVCELAVRVGAAPDFTDYILGRFSQSQTITIGAWNNAGTWTKFAAGDAVQVLCRCINTAGTTNGTGANATVTGGGVGTLPGRPSLEISYTTSGQFQYKITAGSPAGDSYNIQYRETATGTTYTKSGLSAGSGNVSSNVSDGNTYEVICYALNSEGAYSTPTYTQHIYVGAGKLLGIMETLQSYLQTSLSDFADESIIIGDPEFQEAERLPGLWIKDNGNVAESNTDYSKTDANISIVIRTDGWTNGDGSEMYTNDSGDNYKGILLLTELAQSSLKNYKPGSDASILNISAKTAGRTITKQGLVVEQAIAIKVTYYV